MESFVLLFVLATEHEPLISTFIRLLKSSFNYHVNTYSIYNQTNDHLSVVIKIFGNRIAMNKLIVNGKIYEFTIMHHGIIIKTPLTDIARTKLIRDTIPTLSDDFIGHFAVYSFNDKTEVYFDTAALLDLFNVYFDYVYVDGVKLEKLTDEEAVLHHKLQYTNLYHQVPVKLFEIVPVNVPETLKRPAEVDNSVIKRVRPNPIIIQQEVIKEKPNRHNPLKIYEVIMNIPTQDRIYTDDGNTSGVLFAQVVMSGKLAKFIVIRFNRFYNYYKLTQNQPNILDRTIREKFQPSKCKINKRDVNSSPEWVELNLLTLIDAGVNIPFYWKYDSCAFTHHTLWPATVPMPVKSKTKKPPQPVINVVPIPKEPVIPVPLTGYKIPVLPEKEVQDVEIHSNESAFKKVQ